MQKIKSKRSHRKPRSSRKTTTSSSTQPSQINNNHPLFPIGSQVEVSSDEDGFRGAWFPATVLPHPSPKQNTDKIFIEYKTLLANETGPTLLREFIDVNFVRPKPPSTADDTVEIQLDDVVDAYYQDGWWAGVVTQVVVPNSKYKVFFSSPPDELEFDLSDLRVHRIWVDGKWLLPEKQRMRELDISPGTAVEVNIEPDNSRDVWFPATFVKQVSNNSFLVEHQSSREAGFQKVAVDSLHIRPSPPTPSHKTFNLLEKVDAFCDSRWLSGVVTKILSNGRYIIYFKRTKKEKELCQEDLRLHMDWTNGKWVPSFQDASVTSRSEKRTSRANGGHKEKIRAPSEDSGVTEKEGESKTSVEVLRSCKKVSQMPESEKANNNNVTPSSKGSKNTNAKGDTISSRVSRRSNEESASNALLSSDTCKSKTKQTEVADSVASVDLGASSTLDQVEKSTLKQSEDSSQPSDSTEIKGDYEKDSVTRKRGRPRKPRTYLANAADETPAADKTPAADETPAADQMTTDDQTPARCDFVKPPGPIVIGLTYDGKMLDSVAECSGQSVKLEKMAIGDEGKQLAIVADHESAESEQQKEGEVTNLKRKRVPDSVEAETQNDDDVEASADTDSPIDVVEKPIAVVEAPAKSDQAPADTRTKRVRIISDQFKRLGDIRRLGVRNTSRRQGRKQKKISVAAAVDPASAFILRGKKLKSTKLADLPAEDAIDNSGERTLTDPNSGVGEDGDGDHAVTSSNISDDDKPLSLWFEGAHSPPAVDGRGPMAGTGKRCDETEERRDENKMPPGGQQKDKTEEKSSASNKRLENDVPERQDETAHQPTAIVTRANEDLPFVKNSLIWEMIESMEVLKRIPQRPHFRPLYNCKEECREGLAIGSMVTFTSLVERISRTHFDDPKSLLDGYLEALVDLEELGFDVAPVREQLNKMISIKARHEQAQYTAEEIDSQIMERNQEKSKIDDEIEELEKKIAELKRKQAVAESKKERKETEIKLLQSSVDAVKDTLVCVREEFEKVASSLW